MIFVGDNSRGVTRWIKCWLRPWTTAIVVAGAVISATVTAKAANDRAVIVVVVGAAGADEYGPQFRAWAERWSDVARRGELTCVTIGLDEDKTSSDRERLQTWFRARTVDDQRPLWVVLIGHGTFDGKVAKLNLRGPDIAAADLNEWIPRDGRPVAILNCTSCSGPFLSELSAPGRVVATATKSGHECNFARFGDYLSQTIGDPKSDLDKDEQTSLLEAFVAASARTREFYESDARLLTEHALLDDNGDKLGTPAEWFQGLRTTKAAKAGATPDGALARQFVLVAGQRDAALTPERRARRDELERKLAEARKEKSQLDEAAYLARIEPLLVELAELYEAK